MSETSTTTTVPKLGATAREAWQEWKKEEYRGGQACFASHPKLGELCWQIDGLYKVVGPHLITKLSIDDEDAAWDALVAGRLRIYRRRNAPMCGASMEPTQILHEADGVPMATGLTGD